MKIRIAIISPRHYDVPYVWNLRDFDAFEERFVRDNQLIIDDFRLPISNFVKHNKYIGTFDTEEHPRVAYAEIILALSGIDVPKNSGAIHNIKIDIIPDDQDPLKNPQAEAARRADQCVAIP